MKVIFERQAHLLRCVSRSYNIRISTTSTRRWCVCWGRIPHSGSTAWFLHVKSCSISIHCGFFCCNFMFCLIVQSGRCDFLVSFYPSVFLYQKDMQKVLGLLWGMALSRLTVRSIQTAKAAELSSQWAQKAHFSTSMPPPTSPCSPVLQIRILWEWLIKR